MKRNNIPEVIGIIVSLSGIVVMAGWVLGIEVLKSILPIWISMKFITALSFFLSGIALYFIARFQKGKYELGVIILPIISMVILLLMTTSFASSIVGVNTGVEEMFIRDIRTHTPGEVAGRPSVATMVNFILVAIAGILTSFNIVRPNKVLTSIGASIGIVGLTAILGYIFNQPLLYFMVPDRSNPIALHTAIIFLLWGIGAVLIKGNK